MACTCPHHIHRNEFCKHMAAVDNATVYKTLTTFPSKDDKDDAEPNDCDCDGLLLPSTCTQFAFSGHFRSSAG